MTSQDKLLKELSESVDKFNSSLNVIQSNVLAEVELLLKDIKISNGSIVQDVANLKKINQLKDRLSSVIISPEYTERVINFGKAFNTVERIQGEYFAELIEDYTAPELLGQIKKTAIEDTVAALTEEGINANITTRLGQILTDGVESGAKYTDLLKELKTFIEGDKEVLGAFEKYASTVTTDSINTFSATYNKIITDDLGMEWFTYAGSLVGDSREICEKLVAKKYIHKSELPEIVKGIINGKQIPIYKRTGLPYGMKAGTDANNFQTRRGGWRCNHLLLPVPEERVPVEIRSRVKEKDKEAVQA